MSVKIMRHSWIKEILHIMPSMVVAFYAIIPTLSLLLVRINPAYEGIMAQLYEIGGILSVIVIIFSKKYKPSRAFVLIFFTIVIAYILTPNYGSKIELTTPYFVMFTVVPFILPQFVNVDTRMLALFAMIVPSFGVLHLEQLIVLNSENVIPMDLTYSLLVPIVSAIIYFTKYWKDDGGVIRMLTIPFFVANIVYLFYVAFFGSRAPIMSVLLCVLFIYVCKVEKGSKGIVVNKRRRSRVVFFLLLFVAFFMVIVNVLDSILAKYGIDSGTLEKLSRLSGEGDLTNGRKGFYGMVFDAFLRSPVYGYGVSSSPYAINESYPHNFILQFLIDGGILLTLIVLIPMIRHLVIWKKKCTYDDFALITLFMFSSLIGALFSLDVWMNARLWLFFGFLFSKTLSFNRPLMVDTRKETKQC